jgi:rRNA maturation RNase YbeY
MHKQNKITFNYLVKPFFFPKRKALKKFIISHARKQSRAIDTLTYVFCDDEHLLDLNRHHLNHNLLTDIITFPYSKSYNDPIVADIYISIDRVRDNSLSLSVPFQEELQRVIFHGYLHLLGVNDKTEQQKKYMRLKEENLMESFKKCFT